MALGTLPEPACSVSAKPCAPKCANADSNPAPPTHRRDRGGRRMMATALSCAACMMGAVAVATLVLRSSGASNSQSELLISEYATGSNSNSWVELYNPTREAINLSGYAFGRGTHSLAWTGFPEVLFTVKPGAVI